MWKKIVSICAVLFILITSQAHAHVMNADNAYNDLNYTEAKGEILFITALGMTNSQDETATFRPNDSLTMEELAEFVAAYYHLEGGKYGPTSSGKRMDLFTQGERDIC